LDDLFSYKVLADDLGIVLSVQNMNSIFLAAELSIQKKVETSIS